MTNYQTKTFKSKDIFKLEEDVNKFLKGYDFNNIFDVKYHCNGFSGNFYATVVYIG